MSINIGDQRKAGEHGPAGDQRAAGEHGIAGDPRPAGQAELDAADTKDEPAKAEDQPKDEPAKPAKKATAKAK